MRRGLWTSCFDPTSYPNRSQHPPTRRDNARFVRLEISLFYRLYETVISSPEPSGLLRAESGLRSEPPRLRNFPKVFTANAELLHYTVLSAVHPEQVWGLEKEVGNSIRRGLI